MADNQHVWIAVRTFFAQELKICKYLEFHNTRHFVPMTTRYVVNSCGERVRQQQPIVHNLIFIQLDRTVEDMKAILSDCPYPLSVYCKFDHPEQWCEIRDSDMLDLRMMCDNTFCEPVFMTSNESLMKVGRNVRITHGPLSGIHGRLIRKNKKYYIVKSFDGLGVMVTVSRWCCEPEEVENGK